MFRRPLLIIIVLLLVAIVVGLLALAAFPPHVTPVAVERTLSNDSFKAQ